MIGHLKVERDEKQGIGYLFLGVHEKDPSEDANNNSIEISEHHSSTVDQEFSCHGYHIEIPILVAMKTRIMPPDT